MWDILTVLYRYVCTGNQECYLPISSGNAAISSSDGTQRYRKDTACKTLPPTRHNKAMPPKKKRGRIPASNLIPSASNLLSAPTRQELCSMVVRKLVGEQDWFIGVTELWWDYSMESCRSEGFVCSSQCHCGSQQAETRLCMFISHHCALEPKAGERMEAHGCQPATHSPALHTAPVLLPCMHEPRSCGVREGSQRDWRQCQP